MTRLISAGENLISTAEIFIISLLGDYCDPNHGTQPHRTTAHPIDSRSTYSSAQYNIRKSNNPQCLCEQKVEGSRRTRRRQEGTSTSSKDRNHKARNGRSVGGTHGKNQRFGRGKR